jgi:hypothetical protein
MDHVLAVAGETLAFLIASAIILGGYALAAWVVVRDNREAHVTTREYNKISSIIMQTAMAVSERIDSRVSSRIRMINQPRGDGAETTAGGTVDEAPVMGTTEIMDDAHEIAREVRRYRPPDTGEEESPRDDGIGNSGSYQAQPPATEV